MQGRLAEFLQHIALFIKVLRLYRLQELFLKVSFNTFSNKKKFSYLKEIKSMFLLNASTCLLMLRLFRLKEQLSSHFCFLKFIYKGSLF